MSMDTDFVPPISSSTCRTETVYGDHEFKITGYSLIKDLGIGKCIDTKNFPAGGYEWAIRFFPGGSKVASHVSVFMVLASDVATKEVRATVELTMVDQSGRNQHIVTKDETPNSFRKGEPDWGFSRFVEINVLESSNYIKDDCLLIRGRVGIVVMSITRGEEANICSVTVPPSNIGQQFGRFLESEEGSDIRFEVGGETFVAHKFVLAVRSPVFEAQFLGPMKDGDEIKKCIKIVDVEPAVFKALLHFIYWDDVPELDIVFSQHLLEAADRYGLERLQLICQAKLSKGIAIDNVATTLALAEQHHWLQLKSVCLQFIAQQQNLKAVMQTDGFSHLEQSCPSVVCELMRVYLSLSL